MLHKQSLFWFIPALILAVALTVVALHPSVPATGAYGVCWAVPFLWCSLWGGITVWWCKREMVRERLEWEERNGTADKEARRSTRTDASGSGSGSGSGSREAVALGDRSTTEGADAAV